MTKYIFYYGIKNIDESYKKEIIGPTSDDPKILHQLIEAYNNFTKLCKEIKNDNTNTI
jgi:hypothetical protein